jgi:hypothetical protein
MNNLKQDLGWHIEDMTWLIPTRQLQGIILAFLLVVFMASGLLLQTIDPTVGVLDMGILSVLLFALLAAFVLICCSSWLQEFLWQPFKIIRRNLFYHFDQLTSWQQCIIYFSVYFLLLFAALWMLAILF